MRWGKRTTAGQQLELPLTGKVTSTGWRLPAKMTFEEWCAAGEKLGQMERAVAWWIGDWWVFGEKKGETGPGRQIWGYGARKAIVDADEWTGPRFQTCMDYGWVAKKFPSTSSRNEVLSFLHHRVVAGLDGNEARALLDAAAANDWTPQQLRTAIKQRRRAAHGRALGT